MRSRDFRLAKELVSKERAKKILRLQGRPVDNKVLVGKTAHSPKLCSCWMCGNQRKISGDTIKEKRIKDEGDLTE